MGIPEKLTKFLKKHRIYYQILVHPRAFSASETAEAEHMPGKEVVKAVMVSANRRTVMFVLPSTRSLDLFKMSVVLGTDDVRIEAEEEFQKLFPDCELGAMPPFGKLYQLPCYADEALRDAPEIVFNAGSHEESIKISTEDFFRVAKAQVGDYSVPGRKLAEKHS